MGSHIHPAASLKTHCGFADNLPDPPATIRSANPYSMRLFLRPLLVFLVATALGRAAAAAELPPLALPAHVEGQQSDVYVLAVERIASGWLAENGFDDCPDGLRAIFLVVAKAPDAADFAVSFNTWMEINGAIYQIASEQALQRKIPPHIIAKNLLPDFAGYAQGLPIEGKETVILDIYFPGIEIPPIDALKARVFAGWFRKGEPFEISLFPAAEGSNRTDR